MPGTSYFSWPKPWVKKFLGPEEFSGQFALKCGSKFKLTALSLKLLSIEQFFLAIEIKDVKTGNNYKNAEDNEYNKKPAIV